MSTKELNGCIAPTRGAAPAGPQLPVVSTILTSQVPVAQWHEQIGDATIADGTLDRLVHNAHRIELRGESMCKKRNPPRDDKDEKRE